jgi:uncharacterized protein YhjY with autotransporter beta-barrel domain
MKNIFFSNTIKLVLSTIVAAFFIILFTTSNSYSVDCDASYPVTAAKPGQCELTNSGSTVSAGATITIGMFQSWQVKAGNNSSSLINNGTINFDGNPQGVFVGVGLTLGTLSNTGTISSNAPEMIDNEGTITFFNNSGTLNSNGSPQTISNEGTITRMRHTGTLVNFEFTNLGGTIQTLENNDPNLAIVGDNPINYEIIVDSTSDYGKYDGSAGNGSITFSINNTSTLENGTYANVISNVNAVDLQGEEGGTYNNCSWSLTNNGADVWSLVVTNCSAAGGGDGSGGDGSGGDGAEALPDPTTNLSVTDFVESNNKSIKHSIKITNNISRMSLLFSVYFDFNVSDNNNIDFKSNDPLFASLGKELGTKISNKSNEKFDINNWNKWSEGSISTNKIGDTSNSSSIEIDSNNLSFGIDKKINDNEVQGFAFQYGQSDTEIGSNSGSIDSKNYNISTYRLRMLSNNNFISGLAGVGTVENDIIRKDGANTLNGSRDGESIFSSITVGKNVNKDSFNIIPNVRLDLGYTKLDAYNENGTNALAYDDESFKNLMVSSGIRVDNMIKFKNSNVKPFALLEYGLDLSSSSSTKMNYISDTNTIYTYDSPSDEDHSITSEIGFDFDAKDNLNLSTSYRRMQAKNQQMDALKFALILKSKGGTDFAMNFDASDTVGAGFNVAKNINGFDLGFNLDQKFDDNYDPEAKLSLSRKF